MSATLFSNWPDPVVIKGQNYLTPDGPFPRVTGCLKVVGLGTEGLIKWSANTERAATLEAAGTVYSDRVAASSHDPSDFVPAVEARLGAARQHQRILAKAGDIGHEIHGRIQWHLQREMVGAVGPEPRLSSPAALAFSSWRAWWATAGIKPLRVEQVVWDPELEYAGTVDLIGEHEGVPKVYDWKSSKGIYETMHMQVAGYIHAGRRWEPRLMPGEIVRLPKDADGSLEVEVKPLGHLYGGKVRTYEELLDGFKAALTLHRLFVAEAP